MELDRIFTRAEIEQLATQREPRTLVEFQAQAWLRARALEEKRAAREMQERKQYEDYLARKAQPVAVPPRRSLTEGQVRALVRGIAAGLSPELDALGRRLHAVEARSPAAAADVSALPADHSTPAGGAAVVDPVVKAYLDQRLSGTERIVQELDQTTLRYAGGWKADQTYKRGQTVTYKGGQWFCLDHGTRDRPGASSAWRMTVKSGESPAEGPRDVRERLEDTSHRIREVEKVVKKLEEEAAWRAPRHG